MNKFRDIIMNRPMPERVSPKIKPIELPTEKIEESTDDLMFINEEPKEKKETKKETNKEKEDRIKKLIDAYRIKTAFTWKHFEVELFKII